MAAVDYLIVGSGLTGATIARLLADAGREVLVVDRRSHFGGNVHDHSHPSGIRVHTYGPHYFRTESDKIWHFVNRFSDWFRYEAVLKTLVNGQLESWPVTGSYIRQRYPQDWQPSFTGEPGNFEEANLALMPEEIYQEFVKGYTEKQWGVPAKTLSAGLVKRFNVAWDDDPRLMRAKHQALPVNGYADLMSNMLSGIPVLLNVDYLQHRDTFSARRKIIYTGSIDSFFDYRYGKLQYRGQQREHLYLPDTDQHQPYGQVNNPTPEAPHIRTLEWKHMMQPEYQPRIKGTVITTEVPYTPTNPDHYEYPFPSAENDKIYKNYRKLADSIENLIICGRLGEYRYYDMDHAISRAMSIASSILSEAKTLRQEQAGLKRSAA